MSCRFGTAHPAGSLTVRKEFEMDRRRFVVAVAAAAPAAFTAKLARAQDTDAEFQQYIGSITAIMNMLGGSSMRSALSPRIRQKRTTSTRSGDSTF
jgi:hypothetical protein